MLKVNTSYRKNVLLHDNYNLIRASLNGIHFIVTAFGFICEFSKRSITANIVGWKKKKIASSELWQKWSPYN